VGRVASCYRKTPKDESFQTAFEKWALAKFLQFVFGVRFLPTPVPCYGSENAEEWIKYGFRNGSVGVGKLGAYYYRTKNAIEYNLPEVDDECSIVFEGLRELSEKGLELLYEILIGTLPHDFLKQYITKNHHFFE
jgi:hypothetical protein